MIKKTTTANLVRKALDDFYGPSIADAMNLYSGKFFDELLIGSGHGALHPTVAKKFRRMYAEFMSRDETQMYYDLLVLANIIVPNS